MLRILGLPAFRNALLVRGLLLWVAIRLGAAFLGIVRPNVPQLLLVLGAVGAAVLLDARRREEDLFLGNLGIPAGAIVATALPLPLLIESLLRLVLAR